MSEEFQVGDRVEWNETEGEVLVIQGNWMVVAVPPESELRPLVWNWKVSPVRKRRTEIQVGDTVFRLGDGPGSQYEVLARHGYYLWLKGPDGDSRPLTGIVGNFRRA